MLIPVILSGGAGTRLWPVSREGHPKPFMKLADGESLLQKTYRRAASAADGGEILTVTNRDYYFMSKDELSGAGLGDDHQGVYLLEPCGRNTAPAVALAAHHLLEKYGHDALMLVLAADHLIGDSLAFNAAVRTAAAVASQDYLVTFGIVPTAPETGFGYIESGAPIPASFPCTETDKRDAAGSPTRSAGERSRERNEAFAVTRFVEKPSLEKAREYLAAGNFLWNSGMFCFKAGVILEELAKHAPEIFRSAEVCWDAMRSTFGNQSSMLDIPAELFADVPALSLDYAVMEKSNHVAVVPGDFGWSDIGSWSAFSQLIEPDENNNRTVGETILVDSRNTFIQSEDRLVAGVGIDNLMIIDTPDALLVAHPDKAQDVKKIVAHLKTNNHDACRLHRTVTRPWGTYTVLEEGPRFKIKRIVVKPGACLSLQMHHHRSEHWIVVSGMAKVVNGEREIYVNTNESTFIPAGHKHRLENPGKLDLVMIEVQSGDYLGEDDIVRFQDNYGRA
ncbi:mannose-1-phosphate guanylyltransferase/mannose-6-phosphate isomerase [Sulfurivermis fontis]|uniref:mannose-1-phosphate guanylyltransferase/mannose-6-phosphate isomerase n=1 Tax=Sulfurivermis fontis TaxID=1972068 RepID=UPI000FDC3626|nr:mannose-1-phosphate guanylyltransferase/mannose-6-phosphate isomerase [Sulfurivermis fontis]